MDQDVMNEAWKEACRRESDPVKRILTYADVLAERGHVPEEDGDASTSTA